jgi:hypothetical protein
MTARPSIKTTPSTAKSTGTSKRAQALKVKTQLRAGYLAGAEGGDPIYAVPHDGDYDVHLR